MEVFDRCIDAFDLERLRRVVDILTHRLVLTDIQLGNRCIDLQAMADLPLHTGTVDAEIVALIGRRQIERIGRELRLWDSRADDDTVGLIAEQDILEAEAAPSAADIVVDHAGLALCPDALDRAIFIVVATVRFEGTSAMT